MAISAAKVLSIVNSGLEVAGDLVKPGFLEKETGQGTYDPSTLSMSGSSVAQTACRILYDGNAARDGASDTVDKPGTLKLFVADLSANQPSKADKIREGANLYTVDDVKDVSAGTGYLLEVTARKA